MESTKPARRKRRTSEEVTSRILQAAEAEFRQCGYSGATTAAIARKAETTEAQLFRMFSSKAALFREAVFRPLNDHLERFSSSHAVGSTNKGTRRENAELYITELQRFLSEHSQLLLAVLTASNYGQQDATGSEAIDSLNAYFEKGAQVQEQRVGEKPRVDPRLMVRVSFGAVLASVMFKDVLFPKGLADDDDINAAIIDFVLDGISANSE
ncbi:TetR family transcriptional regulator [Novosphingobium sp. PhB165]|uniref:TetR/AcrR family transcriptional regulator n=1 Tax=Novosphingobium sp. PhB165 TaxID=2485105 RepID=UPI0010E42DB5|nr:TetR/AcrR family transcriptional regulator [Novosphingobium sp. PhB165]TCM16089.1 TetR family transcriptional regulator [Novosphingobium sp. PhB165]